MNTVDLKQWLTFACFDNFYVSKKNNQNFMIILDQKIIIQDRKLLFILFFDRENDFARIN